MDRVEQRNYEGLQKALKSVLMLLRADERKAALDGLESAVATYGDKVRQIAVAMRECESLEGKPWPPPDTLYVWQCRDSGFSPEMPVVYGFDPEDARRYALRRVISTDLKMLTLRKQEGDLPADGKYIEVLQGDLPIRTDRGYEPSGPAIIAESEGGSTAEKIAERLPQMAKYGQAFVYRIDAAA